MTQKTRVVVADDSSFVRGLICSYLKEDLNFDVVGTTDNGEEAVRLVERLRPNVVTLDVDMPKVSGLDALRTIMQRCPTPTVMVSGVSNSAAEITRQAIQAGAVDFILKYVPGTHIDPAVFRREVVSKIRDAASVKVVRSLAARFPVTESPGVIAKLEPSSRLSPPSANGGSHMRIPLRDCNVVVIGASTGGPLALRELLQQLPSGFPAAILIVQHIVPAFTSVLTTLLSEQLSLTTCEAFDGQPIQQGTVYVAPGDKHMSLRPDLTLELREGPQVSGHRPSIDVTMQSVVNARPSRVFGVLLTGMGEDGVAGMALLRESGGTTFAQTPETCVVDGMPKRAIDQGSIQIVGSPMEIGWQLRRHVMRFRHSMKRMEVFPSFRDPPDRL